MNENEPPQSPPSLENAPPPPPPQASAGGFLSNLNSNQWAMFLHLSQLTSLIVPGLGIAAPILIWQIQKTQFPDLDRHGKMVTNWLISLLIYVAAAFVGMVATCGVGAVLFLPVALVGIIFPIIGGIKANTGIFWKYPLTISFIK